MVTNYCVHNEQVNPDRTGNLISSTVLYAAPPGERVSTPVLVQGGRGGGRAGTVIEGLARLYCPTIMGLDRLAAIGSWIAFFRPEYIVPGHLHR